MLHVGETSTGLAMPVPVEGDPPLVVALSRRYQRRSGHRTCLIRAHTA
jgi:hypothetical protein